MPVARCMFVYMNRWIYVTRPLHAPGGVWGVHRRPVSTHNIIVHNKVALLYILLDAQFISAGANTAPDPPISTTLYNIMLLITSVIQHYGRRWIWRQQDCDHKCTCVTSIYCSPMTTPSPTVLGDIIYSTSSTIVTHDLVVNSMVCIIICSMLYNKGVKCCSHVVLIVDIDRNACTSMSGYACRYVSPP